MHLADSDSVTTGDAAPQFGIEFWKRIACFGFAGHLRKGIGCVVIREPQQGVSKPADSILEYVRYEAENPEIPAEAIAMLDQYDPSKEVVLLITDKAGKTLALQLTAHRLGCTPIDAYREWSKAERMGRFIPGEVLRLRDPIDGMIEAHYVFLNRDGIWMKLCRAGLDDDDEVCTTDEQFRVHSDFEDSFSNDPNMLVEV
jgi:hypothetical protein